MKPFYSLLGRWRIVRSGPGASVWSFRKVLLRRGRWCRVKRLHLFLLPPLVASPDQSVGLDDRRDEQWDQEQERVRLEVSEGARELGQGSR